MADQRDDRGITVTHGAAETRAAPRRVTGRAVETTCYATDAAWLPVLAVIDRIWVIGDLTVRISGGPAYGIS